MVPRSDPYFGLGDFLPVMHAQRHGIEFGISCDNEIDYGYDIFTEMRFLLTLQRGLAFAETARGESDVPAPLGVRDVLRAATLGGARNAGLLTSVGSLTPGKNADVIVLNLDTVPTRPVGSIPGAVVNFASSTNVDTVFVDGVLRKQHGELVGVNYRALAQQAETIRDGLAPKLPQNVA
jgi:5-methylthioadenosine/S-adenosylhomocysteine deaminase